jgi:transposase-like protein
VAKRRTWWSREFKLAAIGRLKTAPTVGGLAAELGVTRQMLQRWRRAYEAGGAEALNLPGRGGGGVRVVSPPEAAEAPGDTLAAARQRIAELERKVGQQELDLDFFRAALQHVEAPAPRSGGGIGKAFTR